MPDDPLTPLIVGGQEISKVRLAPPDHPKRREVNLGLAIVQLPRLLETFRPSVPMGPQERFLTLLRAFVEAMNGGQRDLLAENDVARHYMETYGLGAYLHHQVYRASGSAECSSCGKPYWKHKYERALLDSDGRPFIHRLCNGDLVKL